MIVFLKYLRKGYPASKHYVFDDIANVLEVGQVVQMTNNTEAVVTDVTNVSAKYFQDFQLNDGDSVLLLSNTPSTGFKPIKMLVVPKEESDVVFAKMS